MTLPADVEDFRSLLKGGNGTPEIVDTLCDLALAALATKAGEGEKGWLIERTDVSPPQYLGGWNKWTLDSIQAIRFCRQEDAFNAFVEYGHGIPTEEMHAIREHMWYDNSPSPVSLPNPPDDRLLEDAMRWPRYEMERASQSPSRDAIVEECARVCDTFKCEHPGGMIVAGSLAHSIRALKTPKEPTDDTP